MWEQCGRCSEQGPKADRAASPAPSCWFHKCGPCVLPYHLDARQGQRPLFHVQAPQASCPAGPPCPLPSRGLVAGAWEGVLHHICGPVLPPGATGKGMRSLILFPPPWGHRSILSLLLSFIWVHTRPRAAVWLAACPTAKRYKGTGKWLSEDTSESFWKMCIMGKNVWTANTAYT